MIDSARPWIVGHRGVAAEATENTLASFELAVTQGVDMIELDVQLSADGELVVFHDWDLTRLADRPEVVEETSARRLAELLPALGTLPEILAALPATMPLNVELKRRQAGPAALAQALESALDERPRVLVSSFDWPLLEHLRRRLPGRQLAPLAHDSTDGLLEIAEHLAAWSVHCHWRLAEAELVRASRRPILVYTVNEAELARELFDRGVAGVFSDCPGHLRRELGTGSL